MPKAVTILSPFHNIPAGDLADQLGALKAEIAALELREKALRDELIRRGVAEVEGSVYDAAITAAVRWTLDAKAVRSARALPAIDGHHGHRAGARSPAWG
jgi:hypothetical protein